MVQAWGWKWACVDFCECLQRLESVRRVVVLETVYTVASCGWDACRWKREEEKEMKKVGQMRSE